MAGSILTAIRRIKSEVALWLTPKAIEVACASVGHVWQNRVLDPVTTVHLFVLQVLHGNTACAHVPRPGGVRRPVFHTRSIGLRLQQDEFGRAGVERVHHQAPGAVVGDDEPKLG
jgi:hypothetical protein